jgi:hypothetical protein
MDKIFRFLQKLILAIDSIIIFLTLGFFIITNIIEKRLIFISYNNANIYISLFYYIFGKIFIGFFAFIILSSIHKKDFIKTSFGIIIPWIICTTLILFYDVQLIKNNLYGGKELFIFIIIISIGTLIWNKVLSYKVELKKPIIILYTLFSVLTNYLMIIIFHIIASF